VRRKKKPRLTNEALQFWVAMNRCLPRRHQWLHPIALAFALWCGAGCHRTTQDLHVATGLISHTLCSETFVGGEDPAVVYAESLKPRPGMAIVNWQTSYTVDRTNREVSATIAGGFASRAVFHDQLGCLLLQGDEPPDLLLPPSDEANQRPALLPEIAGPSLVEPADPDLRAALDHAFAEPTDRPAFRHTKAVIVVRDGEVIAERYAPGYGIATPLPGYSASKSIINAMLGILVREHKLTVEQRAPVAAWSDANDPRHAITIDELERMTSGLALDETGSPQSPVSKMLYLERDMANYAESAGLEATPGRVWNYSSGNTLILSRLIRDAVGGHTRDVLGFARRELFAPLGMRHVTMEFDATGTPVGSTYILAPARDWARFGMLYLDDGVVGGQRILPEGWVTYSSTPTLESDYGAGFWVNRGNNRHAVGRRRGGMPADAFYASGILGQRVVIIPSQRLVITRFGAAQDWDDFDIEGLLRLVREVIAATHNKNS
jgi:CubicO group peptidase (beta-lactamase class C family)